MKPFGQYLFLAWCLAPAFVFAQKGTSYADSIARQRRLKDEQFKQGPDSPLKDQDKRIFAGLHYFPADAKYCFKGTIAKNPHPESFSLVTSDGRSKKALRYGAFAFQLDGKTYQLQVYKLLNLPAAYQDYLFIPFTDATSGTESYGGGRYIDLNEQRNNTYLVDFNLAYNPSCAYGRHDFSCPIPPAENRLPIRIPAGEKKWKE